MTKRERMKIKVCGMKYPENIRELSSLDIDFMGFIFYEKSSRYIDKYPGDLDFAGIKKTGVFVDSDYRYIKSKINEFKLDFIQLHGNESPDFCSEFKEEDVMVIKAFRVDNKFDFDICKDYLPVTDLFLFDAKGENPGGNGIVFNWKKMQEYKLEKQFLLSGGIGINHSKKLKDFYHPQCIGFDINSGFETAPGVKNIELIKRFIDAIRS